MFLSPFRYPGGKSRFAPKLGPWFASHRQRVLLEPFAGGASVSLWALSKGWVDRAVLLEKDPAIASVWRCILDKEKRAELVRLIASVADPAGVGALPQPSGDDLELAFWTLCRNRTSFGGVVTARGGACTERGQVLPRWNAATTIARIERIGGISSRISFFEWDGVSAIEGLGPGEAAFVDPPYPGVGARLYGCCDVDHDRVLAAVADSAHALATYGEHPLIRSGIEALGLDCVSVEVNGNCRSSKELIIARNLGWLQPAQLSLFGLMD